MKVAFNEWDWNDFIILIFNNLNSIGTLDSIFIKPNWYYAGYLDSFNLPSRKWVVVPLAY
jgi:hypothetical protein